MKKRFFWALLLGASLASGFAGADGESGEKRGQAASSESLNHSDWGIQSSLARGGRLYDKWFKEAGKPTPKELHPAYPATSNYAKKPDSHWRCKECHGWDYQGKEGAYASGKHYSGIKGIQAMAGKKPDQIISLLKNDTHRLTGLISEADFQDLALFVSKGQVDMDQFINRSNKKVMGANITKGEAYYQTICANCHGKEGWMIKEMPPLGKVSNANPWETLHKILNGQPMEEMPALRALSLEPTSRHIPLDILAYIQTLPEEKPSN
ncbi:MAG: cytochrome c [Magnetococcales bacterium]|nr:cytochrome c [Magnetococcales bacterium]